jgi:hypothetical protein
MSREVLLFFILFFLKNWVSKRRELKLCGLFTNIYNGEFDPGSG